MSSRDQHLAASGRQVTPRGASIYVAWRGVQKQGKRGCAGELYFQARLVTL
jgi:hypothetical protein